MLLRPCHPTGPTARLSAWSSALEEISQARGVLYDSEVVDACLRLLKKNEPEFDRLMAAAANLEYASHRN